MDSYLYYKRGEEWVRVSADAYFRTEVATGYQLYVGPNWIRSNSPNCILAGEYIAYGNVTVAPAETLVTYESFGSGQCSGDTYRLTFNGYAALFRGRPIWKEEPVNECKTTFTLNGSTVLMLDTCPDVISGDSCSECCSELVAIARQIQI